MKDDAPLPDRVPAKRRAVEQALDLHIAMWLASDGITPSERRRLTAEKERRKRLRPDNPVGVLVGAEGVTPGQQTALVSLLALAKPTTIHHPGVASRLHQECKRLGVPVVVHDDGGMREVVRKSHLVIGAPKSADDRATAGRLGGVWEMIRYAKHRSVATRVVLPNGEIYTGHDGT